MGVGAGAGVGVGTGLVVGGSGFGMGVGAGAGVVGVSGHTDNVAETPGGAPIEAMISDSA